MLLPLSAQERFGHLIGRILYRWAKELRHITTQNIIHCFPHLPKARQDELIRQSLENMGLVVIEVGLTLWASEAKLRQVYSTESFHHLTQLKLDKQGVLIVGAHFSLPDFCMRMFAQHFSVDAVARPFENPVVNHLMMKSRKKHLRRLILNNDIKGVVRSLKQGGTIWYAVDLDLGEKNSSFVPFMGVPAATSHGASRIAKMTGAKVVPIIPVRNGNRLSYSVKINPALEGFPSGDDEKDAKRLTELVEASVDKQPQSYFWQYKRFRTRPLGEPEIYWRRRVKLKKMSQAEHEAVIEPTNALFVKSNQSKVKLRRSPEGYLLKYFYDKSFYRTPRAKRFVTNARKLEELGINAPIIKRFFLLPHLNAYMVAYKELPGTSIRDIVANGQMTEELTVLLARYIFQLHEQGIYFRALHAGNILWDETKKRFLLIDITDISFRKRPLPKSMRLRNFKPFFRYKSDLAKTPLNLQQTFIDEYTQLACLTAKERATLEYLSLHPVR